MSILTLPSQTNAQNYNDRRYDNREQNQSRYDRRDEEPEFRMTRCQKLEQQLANIYIRKNNGSRPEQIAELSQRIATEGQNYKALQRKADRKNCYETAFLFGKTLRRTRKCIALDRRIRQSKNRLIDLNDKRDNIRNPSDDTGQRDSILNALARNRCGKRYENRRSSFGDSIFGDDGIFGGGSSSSRRNAEPDQIMPYATYRTMCVKLCDGSFFPVSFSALPSKFDADRIACQDRCAAPTQLFVYRNPGAEIEQMIEPQNGMPYSKLPNAWKFKKKFVKGCSCKVTEYKPEGELPDQKDTSNEQTNNTESSGFKTTVQKEELEDLEQPKTTPKKK